MFLTPTLTLDEARHTSRKTETYIVSYTLGSDLFYFRDLDVINCVRHGIYYVLLNIDIINFTMNI